MNLSRRSVLSTIAGSLPFAIAAHANASSTDTESNFTLRFRSFEESVRRAFSDLGQSDGPMVRRRVEIGHSDLVHAGIQGSHNDRSFAGFPSGHLKIVRISSEPGPVSHGVRLYLTTVEVALTGGQPGEIASRPLDFASLPPAPIWRDAVNVKTREVAV